MSLPSGGRPRIPVGGSQFQGSKAIRLRHPIQQCLGPLVQAVMKGTIKGKRVDTERCSLGVRLWR